MRLPLHISLDKTADELEAKMREAILRDKGINSEHKSVALIFFVHHKSGAVAFMYAALYMANNARYESVLNLMEWERLRTVIAPTCHAAKLKVVPS